ncbi:MAG TPA: endolytic transglycosylase MltG, partial [Hyphomicrobiales bacterium]|nr:endolytic transglycosylase MltG [Hyphomicrobiales bacterium]
MLFGRKSSKPGKPEVEPDSPQETAPADSFETLEFDEAPAADYYPRSPSEAIQPESVPGPPDDVPVRRHPLVRFANAMLSLVIFLLIIAGGTFFILKQQFEGAGPLRQTRAVIVPAGATVSQIADRLEQEGVISDGTLFQAGVYLANVTSDLKAGEYLFQEQVSMREVMDQLTEGRSILHRITIPEGLTSQQIVARLNQEEVLTGEIEEVPAEGTLLPETYSVTRGTSRQAVIDRMLRAHDRTLARIWERRDKDLPLETPEELVTLASIVEKETGKVDERPRVASVFVNRLKRGMRLQSDPTIIYGLVGGEGSLGRPIRRSEIDKPTPYNTYQIRGLPPTPIANPGAEALEATANPSRTNDLYFVADGTGGHVFAPTLAEHNRNVRRWRQAQNEAEARREQAAQE